MKSDIVLAGVGGQGILSIAAVVGLAAIEADLYIKQAEVHGMSQRGGAVLSHLRISSKPIYSDMVPEGRADMILSAEPMESLRYLPYLAPDGWIVTNSTPFVNIPNYPDIDAVRAEIKKYKNHVMFDADAMAKEVGNPRAGNMVIAGAASVFMEIPFDKMENGVRAIFQRKGEPIVNKNLDALNAGRKFALEHRGG
jgi:indolepyruvate ferredoxin oxidoreductase beta subunit